MQTTTKANKQQIITKLWFLGQPCKPKSLCNGLWISHTNAHFLFSTKKETVKSHITHQHNKYYEDQTCTPNAQTMGQFSAETQQCQDLVWAITEVLKSWT